MADETLERTLSFTHQLTDGGVRAVLALTGEVDIGSGPLVEDHLNVLVAEGVRELVLDLSGVRFIDSAGLNLLLHARSCLVAHGGTCSVRGASPSVARLLELSGLTHLVSVT